MLAASALETAQAGDRESHRQPTEASKGAAGIQLAQDARRYDFTIATQPLDSAVQAFSRQSGLPVALEPGLAAGRSSGSVTGSFTAQEAMELLLAGTGLNWRFSGDGSIAVNLPQAQADGGAYTLPPLTVTGEKTDRSVMDTSTSVIILDAETIEQRAGLESTNDALARVPNMTSTGTGNYAPVIRGVAGTGAAEGADAFFAGSRPRMNMQIDGRPANYNEVVFGDISLWDVQQVEVLRGAQSQLQGRNAIAGTVVVKSKDPTYDFEAGARLFGGNFETIGGSGVVSGPIVDDQLAVRLSFDTSRSDGFVHMQGYPGVDDPQEFRNTTVRGKLLIEPENLEGFSTLVTLSYADYTAPQSEDVTRPFDEHAATFPLAAVFNPETKSAVVETTWELTDDFAFENRLSVADVKVLRHAMPGDGNVRIDGLEIMEEPLMRFSGFDERLSGIAGVFYFDAEQNESIDLFGGGSFDDSITTAAVFAEVTYALLDDLDITAGGRFEEEHHARSGGVGPFLIDLDETYRVFLPKVGVAWHASDELTVGAVVSRGYNGGGAGFTYNPPFQSYTYDPEYVWTYEAYGRAELYGGRLNLTGNVFFSDYKDMQLPFDLNPDPAIWASVIRNADRAITYGGEVGARWLATPELELFADFGLLKTEVTDNPGSGVEGHELPFAPVFTADFGGIYRHESGLEFGADAFVSDGYYSSIINEPRGKTDPYVTVNAKLGYRFTDYYPEARIFAFATNLFDSGAELLLVPGATPADDAATVLHPRTFGVGLEMKF